MLNIDSKTRSVVKIKPKTGFETYVEMKEQDLHQLRGLRLKKLSGNYELTDEGKR